MEEKHAGINFSIFGYLSSSPLRAQLLVDWLLHLVPFSYQGNTSCKVRNDQVKGEEVSFGRAYQNGGRAQVGFEHRECLLAMCVPLEGLFQNLKERPTFVVGPRYETAQRSYSHGQALNVFNV